jgi:hypothetical protein
LPRVPGRRSSNSSTSLLHLLTRNRHLPAPRLEGPPLLVLERLLSQRVVGGEDQRAAGAFLLQLLLRQLRSRCGVQDMDARDAAPARADRSDGGRVALAVGHLELEVVVLEQLDVDDGRGVVMDAGRFRVPGGGSSLRLVAGVGRILSVRCRGRNLRLRFTHRHDADVSSWSSGQVVADLERQQAALLRQLESLQEEPGQAGDAGARHASQQKLLESTVGVSCPAQQCGVPLGDVLLPEVHR